MLGQRFAGIDAQGIDVEALSIDPSWYHLERDLAADGPASQRGSRRVVRRAPRRLGLSPRCPFRIPTSRWPLEHAVRDTACARAMGGWCADEEFTNSEVPPGVGEAEGSALRLHSPAGPGGTIGAYGATAGLT